VKELRILIPQLDPFNIASLLPVDHLLVEERTELLIEDVSEIPFLY